MLIIFTENFHKFCLSLPFLEFSKNFFNFPLNILVICSKFYSKFSKNYLQSFRVSKNFFNIFLNFSSYYLENWNFQSTFIANILQFLTFTKRFSQKFPTTPRKFLQNLFLKFLPKMVYSLEYRSPVN